MRKILIATILLIPMASMAQYGPPPYGGPPMWDRRVGPEEGRRWPPTRSGPQMEPCIRYGECRGPRYEDDPEESWRRPRRRYDERWN